jgi:hypothetical protein
MDVNVMWHRPQEGRLPGQPRRTVGAGDQRARGAADLRSAIRDVFNEITSEEYYQVSVKNRVAGKARTSWRPSSLPTGS